MNCKNCNKYLNRNTFYELRNFCCGNCESDFDNTYFMKTKVLLSLENPLVPLGGEPDAKASSLTYGETLDRQAP